VIYSGQCPAMADPSNDSKIDGVLRTALREDHVIPGDEKDLFCKRILYEEIADSRYL